jgi:hypothetical protein
MMLTQAICVLVAPAAAYAAAFPWALPEPTIFAPAPDNWSPAPTAAPQLPGFSPFKRQSTPGDNTCGFVSGSSRTNTSRSLQKHQTSNKSTRILNNMPKHLHMRHQHPQRRSRVLRPQIPRRLHNPHNMHPQHRPIHPLHRLAVLHQLRHPKMHRSRSSRMFQMAHSLQQDRNDATRLRVSRLH